MTRAKELLEQTTPLPWRAGDFDKEEDGTPVLGGGEAHSIDEGMVVWVPRWDRENNAALIVYAVNRLPDYEAAVEALDRLVAALAYDAQNPPLMRSAPWMDTREVLDARAALARLRDEVPHGS